MKRVVIVGSGNVAESLAQAVAASPYRLVQIFARNVSRGTRLARAAGCTHTDDPSALAQADIYLIAVSDRAVAPVSEALDFGRAVVAHTAGSVSRDELSAAIPNRGVFYPLQTFTAGRIVPLGDVPLFIEGENPETTAVLRELAGTLSRRVFDADSERRKRLHLAAVFACNFTNHMIAVGQRLMEQSGLPADALNPLLRETADKALSGPRAAALQTGPASRGDRQTMERHTEMLAAEPELQNLYKLISLNIWETSRKI